MSVAFEVYVATLHSTARDWDDAQERLTGVSTSLAEADVALLGSRVAPAARAFVAAWEAEIRRLQQRTGQHAQALRDTATGFRSSDQEVVERNQTLLAFVDRDMTPSSTMTVGGIR